MTAPLSPERIAEIKARTEKMPPETWEYEKNGDRKQVWAYSRMGYKNYLICQYDAPNAWEYTPDFIAHARQDIPALVAEVEHQAAEIERLRSGIKDALHAYPAADICEDGMSYVETKEWKETLMILRRTLEGAE